MENAEINNIIKILGLQYKNKYEDPDSLKKLRYGKLMIMADQDQDGSHIKGLVINFIHNNWPNLLKHNFVEEFITPIVKVRYKILVNFFPCVVCECDFLHHFTKTALGWNTGQHLMWSHPVSNNTAQ